MATWDVFLSYARSSAGEPARRAHRALEAAGVRSFLDERDIALDSEFQRDLADALLGSRLVLIFADAEYFQKRWCVYELEAALAPVRAGRPDATEHLVVVLAGDVDLVVPHLPPALARSNLSGLDPAAVVERVRARLATVTRTLAERLDGLDDYAVRTLRDGGAVPPASSLAAVPGLRAGMPASLNDRLAGRAPELWTLFHSLVTVAGAGRSCCIHGAPGTGKSQLVAEFVWRYAGRHFPGGVVWIDAGGEPTTLAERLRRATESVSQAGRVLWIVDGVPEPPPGQRERALAQWCPARETVTLLCTSRRARSLDVDLAVELDPLPEAASVDLLTRPPVQRPWLAPEDWSLLARWVGRLPQALGILHAVLASRFRTAADCVALARAADPVQGLETSLAEIIDEIPEGALRGIAQTFGIWYQHLAQDGELRKAAHLLARARLNPVSDRFVPRPVLARLAHRSWLMTAHGADDSAPAAERDDAAWRMNDLVASYLRGVSPDPAVEIARLAGFYLGFHGGQRTVMFGEKRGGLDLLSNVRSVGAETLEGVLVPLLARALTTPDDLDAAGAAEVLGALRHQPAWRSLADALAPDRVTAWAIGLYMRYVQGFAHAPPEPRLLARTGDTWTLDAASVLPAAVSAQERAALLAPLMGVLAKAPVKDAAFAARLMARAKETRPVAGTIVLQLVNRVDPDRLFAVAGSLVDVDDTSAPAWAACGAAFQKLGERDNAVGAFERAVALEPKFPWAHEQLAGLLAETDAAAALAHVERALELDPPRVATLLLRATCLVHLQRWTEVSAAAEKVLELDATEPLAWFVRAQARAATGDVKGALLDVERALELDPANENARRLHGTLRQGGRGVLTFAPPSAILPDIDPGGRD